MHVHVVLNPYANRWGAKAQIDEVQSALRAAQITFDLTVTAQPRHGIAAAREAAAGGCDAVIAAGGDGTINEVLNGVLQAAAGGAVKPFGILPLGTANDFYKTIGLPAGVQAAAAAIARGQARMIDVGQVNGHYFINNSAVAMEPMVTLENIKMTRFSGELRYVVALIRALIRLQAWQMQISWDEGGYDGPAYLLSICNGPRTGGFYMAPEAVFDDGRFDFVFVPEVSKLTVVAILARLFRQTHIHHPQVTYARTRRLSLQSVPGTPIHADGEILSEAETAVTYELLPSALPLLVND